MRSACTLSRIGAGVPAGAHKPYHEVTSKPGSAGLVHRRHRRQLRYALQARHRERAHAAGLDRRQHCRRRLHADGNLASDHVGERLRRAFVRDVHDVDLRRQLEQLHRELRRCAGGRRAVGELAGVRPRIRDELLHECAQASTGARRGRSGSCRCARSARNRAGGRTASSRRAMSAIALDAMLHWNRV